LQNLTGRLLIFVILLLSFYIATAEIVVRANEGRAIMSIPSIGSTDKGFEGRLNTLHAVSADKPLDCIFLGDSTAMTDFAPHIFSDSFRQKIGADIDCFNFGVGAFTVADIEALAKIVVLEHSPQLLIIGVESLNFTVPSIGPGGADFAELPWTQYKLGHFTSKGWLYEHSALYRHLGAIQQLITLQASPTEMRRQMAETNSSLHDGFYPMDRPGPFDISQPPDPNSDHPYHENYFGSLTNYQLLPEQLAALDQIVALNNASTQVILVEMPVPPTFYYYFGNGEQDYDRFIAAVDESVSGTTIPFWRTTDLALFPDSVWFNYNHLNATGAPIFSEWLGEQLGQAVTAGTVRFSADEETNSR
jgi:hypothetical protein